MSWSVNAIGKPTAVSARIAKEIAAIKCTEPEESIKNLVGAMVSAALAAYPDFYAVKVEANGSQSPGYSPDTHQSTGLVNSLSVSIVPFYNFLG